MMSLRNAMNSKGKISDKLQDPNHEESAKEISSAKSLAATKQQPEKVRASHQPQSTNTME